MSGLNVPLDNNDNLWPEDFIPDNSGNDSVLALGGRILESGA